MRTYQINENEEKMYELECMSFNCKYSPDAIITVIWKKEYEYDLKCKKCGGILTETINNWKPMIT